MLFNDKVIQYRIFFFITLLKFKKLLYIIYLLYRYICTYTFISFQICTNIMGRYTGKKCRLLTMLWLTALFFLVEIVVGYVTNSMALIADSFHMLSDVAALVVAFLSVKVSFKPVFSFVEKSSGLIVDCDTVSIVYKYFYIADVAEKMVQEYLWLGQSRGIRSLSKCCVLGRSMF